MHLATQNNWTADGRAKADADFLGRVHRRSRPPLPRRPERRLGLGEAVGHAAGLVATIQY